MYKTALKRLCVVAVLCLPLGSTSQSVVQVQKTITCAELKWLVQLLLTDYGEIPIFAGLDRSGKSKYLLTMNHKTETWTMIEHDNEVACVIGTGSNGVVSLSNILKNGKTI